MILFCFDHHSKEYTPKTVLKIRFYKKSEDLNSSFYQMLLNISFSKDIQRIQSQNYISLIGTETKILILK